MYVFHWVNKVAALEMFFIERFFVFFKILLLKKIITMIIIIIIIIIIIMIVIIIARKPHCHSRLSKPILKILSISIKKIS